MPKRKAKKPVGRPKKQRIKESAEGKIFATEYGSFRFDWAEQKELIKTTPEIAKKLVSELIDIVLVSQQEKTRFQHCPEDLLDDCYSTEQAKEILELSEMSKALLDIVMQAAKDGDWAKLKLIALAFSTGQLSVIQPQRQHETVYQMGRKIAKSAVQGGEARRIDRPTKAKLQSELRQQIAKHGKKTLAVSSIAKHYGVSPNTVRAWMKELSITLK